MEEEKEKQKKFEHKLKENTEQIICDILESGIEPNNIDYLGKVVDIHKDISNEEYWEKKQEVMQMRYRGNYNNYMEDGYGNDMYGNEPYGRRGRDSRGRYTMRGRDARYRGDEYMADMSESYHNYEEGKENYGADESTIKSLKEMLTSVERFMKHLEENAESQQEVNMIKQSAEKIARG